MVTITGAITYRFYVRKLLRRSCAVITYAAIHAYDIIFLYHIIVYAQGMYCIS